MNTNIDAQIELTGYFNGDRWSSEREVREYFQVDEMKRLFPGEEIWPQEDLDAMAAYAIEERLHWEEADA